MGSAKVRDVSVSWSFYVLLLIACGWYFLAFESGALAGPGSEIDAWIIKFH